MYNLFGGECGRLEGISTTAKGEGASTVIEEEIFVDIPVSGSLISSRASSPSAAVCSLIGK